MHNTQETPEPEKGHDAASTRIQAMECETAVFRLLAFLSRFPARRTRNDTANSLATFQQRVHPWMLQCFGPEITADHQERNHRFLEESLELVQSLGCTEDEVYRLVRYVYGRAKGEPHQEVGGVMVTLAALCNAAGLSLVDDGECELARINTPEITHKIREKQRRKPSASPLPGVYPERKKPSESTLAKEHCSANRMLQARLDKLEAEGFAITTVLAPVLDELARALTLFPAWPTDPLHAAGVVAEEAGELQKAVMQEVYTPAKNPEEAVSKESMQTATASLRFIASLCALQYRFAPCEQHSQFCAE